MKDLGLAGDNLISSACETVIDRSQAVLLR